jgi:tellurite resistance protein TerC
MRESLRPKVLFRSGEFCRNPFSGVLMTTTWLLWAAFGIGVCSLLALDLGVFNRRAHAPKIREAALWSLVWFTAAALFGAGVWRWRGGESALQFVTAYLIELSLSVDNVFLFVLIFGAFAVPQKYRHRVLFWGVIGAVVMRAIMIVGGAALIARFHWVVYVFGGLLLITAVKMVLDQSKHREVADNWLVRLARRVIPVSERFEGQRFFTKVGGRTVATPLLLVLVLIEGADLMFAIDSIPAVFAIFPDPRQADTFIVFTSNVFAILGLRSLYFLLADVMDRFRFLRRGLAGILAVVGLKMLGVLTLSATGSLAVILSILATAAIASVLAPGKKSNRRAPVRRGNIETGRTES